MAGRDVWRTGVDILSVDFVGEEIEVVFLYQVAYLVHLAACVKIARGVVRVANHYRTGALVDQFLELFDLRKRETFVYRGGNGAYLCPCRDGKSHVVGVCRLGNDAFVARVQA